MAPEKEEVVSFECPDLNCESVTVYSDRAEIKKVIKTKLKKGTSVVVVNNVPSAVKEDSIRVEGKGRASIWEVQYEEKEETLEPTEEENKEALQSKEKVEKKKEDIDKHIRTLKQEQNEINSSKTLIEQQEKIFKTATTKVAENVNTSQSKNETEALTLFTMEDEHIASVDKFLAFYGKTAESYHGLIRGFDVRLEDISSKIDKLKKEKANLKPIEYHSKTVQSRKVSITVETSEEGVCELTVSYMVTRACWRASYDFRVFTEEKTIKVYYYGMIQQRSGEDWKNVKLSLTTAEPRIHGEVPALKTLKARIIQKPKIKDIARPRVDLKRGRSTPDYYSTGYTCQFTCASAKIPRMAEPTAMVRVPSGPGFSANFDIMRRASIPSDKADHKVNVGILTLTPEFMYETVPSKSPHVYPKIKVINNTTYILLPGPTQIFVNNNFVTKGELHLVSPMEEFSCSLGIEPMIKVEYKPRKFREEHRKLMGKTVTETSANKTELKNTTKDPIKVKLVEQVPLSEDEKIKVNLLEPKMSLEETKEEEKKEGDKPFSLNSEHNVEWDVDVGAGKTRTVQVKYTLSYPKTEDVELVEG